VYYYVPELGIKFPVKKVVKDDLIYKYRRLEDKAEVISFSSNTLSQIPYCGVEDSPLGVLVKLKGKPADYSDRVYYEARNPKQFNDFFIIYNGPQAVCASEDRIDELDKYFDEHPEFKGWIVEALEGAELLL